MVFANLAFAGLVGGDAAIGEDEAGHARGREVVEEVLPAGVIGAAGGRHAELPAGRLRADGRRPSHSIPDFRFPI